MSVKAKRVVDTYHTVSKQTEEEIQWGLVEQYLPLVKSIVSRMRIYFPDHVDVEDLNSIGISGLITSAKNYDPSKGKNFSTFARIRIKGALLDELRRLDWLSRDDRSAAKKYKKSIENLEQQLGRPPSDAEICDQLNISHIQNEKLKEIRKPIFLIPLDSCCGTEDAESPIYHDLISDPTEQNGRDIAENHELVDLLRECLEELNETQQQILAMYYLENLRLAEIAIVLNKTESRICQIHSQALADLRIRMRQKMKT